MLILGIESSCDETAASVIKDGREIMSNVVASQIDEHKKFGGVVPEIASRRHCENILPVVEQALFDANVRLDEIDAVGVTYAPGLIGALLVGVSFAKSLAVSLKIPLIPVHHITAHIASNYLTYPTLEPPYLCLVVSGGHTHIIEVLTHTKFRVIGRTRDDAAGECFDKSARALEFPYPGGIHIDKAAQKGNADAYKLPHPNVDGSEYDFSFSGLKTAVINTIHKAAQKGESVNKEDISAALQRTISEILTQRTIAAAAAHGYQKIALAGGVAANSGIRRAFTESCAENGMELYLPEISLCGDNAAMVGCQAYYNLTAGICAAEDLNAYATLSVEEHAHGIC